MRPERRTIAAEVFAAGREYDAAQGDRLARLRNVEPETAQLLGVLVRAIRARRVLEIGTSNGHSTLWLADAAEAVGGQVETLDIDPRRTEQALANLNRSFSRLLGDDPQLTNALVPIGAGLIVATLDA
jgi:predicted O-methyltransferase YrrM